MRKEKLHMSIEILDDSRDREYDEFILRDSRALFYASNKYRKLLKKFLHSEDKYFLAINDNNDIIGVLPAFIKRNQRYGHVLNSLPFYGSYGGIIEYDNNTEVKTDLLRAFYSFAEETNCISSTIITSPFERETTFYERETNYLFRDERIGQITQLPYKELDVTDALLKQFNEVRRRNIRKARKSGVHVIDKHSSHALNFLLTTHQENIRSIKGISKPALFFEMVTEFFEYDHDYKIFTAFVGNTPVAALLLFYFNKTVEYFTPVVVQEYRSLQPLSLVIFEAMEDAAARGYQWWNWGGTWKNQKGLYDFKKKWWAKEYPYYYFINVYDKGITGLSEDVVLREYPYYYVLPFDRLNDERTIKIGESHMRRKSNG